MIRVVLDTNTVISALLFSGTASPLVPLWRSCINRGTLNAGECRIGVTIEFKKGGAAMRLELTAVFRKVPEGYIGFVEELPGANTQGSTLEETRANLREAVLLVLEANRTLAENELGNDDVIREPIAISQA